MKGNSVRCACCCVCWHWIGSQIMGQTRYGGWDEGELCPLCMLLCVLALDRFADCGLDQARRMG